MKKIRILIPALMILLIGIDLYAGIFRNPVRQGRFVTGGSVNLTSVSSGLLNSSGSGSGTSFNMHPYLQYFVANGWALGGEIFVDYSDLGDNDYKGVGFGPVIKYFYHPSARKNFYPYTGMSFLPGYYNDDSNDTEFTQIDLSLFAGNIFMIGTNAGFDIKAAYTFRGQYPNGGESASGGVFSFFVGFAIFL